jgi:hypothetical protein
METEGYRSVRAPCPHVGGVRRDHRPGTAREGELEHMSKREQRANGDMVSYAGGSFAQSSRSMRASDHHSYSDASIQALVVR